MWLLLDSHWVTSDAAPVEYELPTQALTMAVHPLVQFESIVLQDQRIRSAADDYMLSVVHLVIRHPDGLWCPGCVASVRHRFRGANGGAVEINVQLADQCAAYADALKPLIEDYYRDHVGPEGAAIRVGRRGASPWLIGVQRLALATVSLGSGDARRHGPHQ